MVHKVVEKFTVMQLGIPFRELGEAPFKDEVARIEVIVRLRDHYQYYLNAEEAYDENLKVYQRAHYMLSEYPTSQHYIGEARRAEKTHENALSDLQKALDRLTGLIDEYGVVDE